MAGVGDHEQLRVGDPRGDGTRARGRGAQVLGAGEQQRRHVRQRLRGGRRGGGVGPVQAGGDQAVFPHGGGVERVEGGARQRVQRGERFGAAGGRRRGALPGEGLLLAGGREEQRVVFFFVGFPFGLGASRLQGHVGDQPFGEQLQPQQRVGVVAQRGLHRGGQQRAQRGVEVAGDEHVVQVGLPERGGVPVPGAVVHRAVERVFAKLCGQRGDVGERVGGDVRAGPFRAELFEYRRQRLDRGEPERFGAFGEHDRVEHERFDVGGVLFGVLERDLRAVGGPVQHELFVARRFADRLDVLHRFLGCKRAARGPELQRALFVELAAVLASSSAGELWQ